MRLESTQKRSRISHPEGSPCGPSSSASSVQCAIRGSPPQGCDAAAAAARPDSAITNSSFGAWGPMNSSQLFDLSPSAGSCRPPGKWRRIRALLLLLSGLLCFFAFCQGRSPLLMRDVQREKTSTLKHPHTLLYYISDVSRKNLRATSGFCTALVLRESQIATA